MDFEKDNLTEIRALKTRMITGQLTIVAMSVCAFYTVVFYLSHIMFLAVFSLATGILASISRIAWQKGYTNYARISIIFLGNMFIFALCGSMGRQSGINALYFPLSCAILILFNLRQLNYIIACLAITFTCLIILEIFNYSVFNIERPGAMILDTMQRISMFVAIVVAMACVFSMQIAADEAEKTLGDAQNEIKNYARKLEYKNKELEQFSYIASHDLNEPLRTVSSFVGLLKDDYYDKLDETAKKSLDFIRDAIARMAKLIKGLLDYSRLGQNSQSVKIDFNKLLRSVCDDLSASINQAGAKIHIGNLPTIMAYETEVRILFQNLLSNAIKFRKPGVQPEIYIDAEVKDGLWKFSMKDNGIGIEPGFKDKIFIIFQRLHNRQDYEGTGIGLSQCKKIVELHNGTISFDSVPGEGSTFYFTLNS